MKDKLSLMIPGPTPVPERVLKALGQHPIGHRSQEFQEIINICHQLLKWLHQTKQDVLTITGSGTAAMEAAIINTLSFGDKVICGSNGKFGDRWIKVAKAYGLEVIKIEANWGEPLDTEKFREILEADKDKTIRAVIVTHSETSTGVLNDLETIAKHVNNHQRAITIADCVTSLGACNVPMDEWGIDVIASGSQKGYMMPPGLSFVAMSEKALAASSKSDLPKFYLDLNSYRKSLSKNNTPYTPSVNLYFSLKASLEMMQDEGLVNIFNRHEKHKKAVQKSMKAIGLHLFANENFGSPAITALYHNDIDAEELRKKVKNRFDIQLAGGQDHLKGKVFRVGHLGFVNDRDILGAVAAIEACVQELGKNFAPVGTGTNAALSVLK